MDVCCAVWANIVDDGVRERVKPFRLLLYKAKVNGCVKLMFSFDMTSNVGYGEALI